MKVYVLESCVDYEGGVVRGVYATEELAEQAREKFHRERVWTVDSWEITEFEVEGLPEQQREDRG